MQCHTESECHTIDTLVCMTDTVDVVSDIEGEMANITFVLS